MMPRSRSRARVVSLALLLALVIGAFVLILRWENRHLDFSSDSQWELAELVEYEDELYALRDDVETYLLIGVDTFSDAVSTNSYNNDQCADFLLLLVIDHTAKRCSAVQINRDTMAEVTMLGVGGKKLGTVQQQISLSHTYGTGAEDSCRNTARAVSGMLFGVSIDHFTCLTMDAIAVLNDLVGGVTLTPQEDLTALHPAFVKGVPITLTSEQALLYVRHRSALADSSNASRMKRQEQYMQALYGLLLDYVQENESFSTDVLAKLSKHMISDGSVNELERTVDVLSSYERGEIYSVSGTQIVGDYVEFYPDEQALKKMIIELFYEKVK